MTLFLALIVAALLLQRIGVLRPIRERRALQKFEANLLQLGEDVQWEEHMTRRRRNQALIHRTPQLCFKMGH